MEVNDILCFPEYRTKGMEGKTNKIKTGLKINILKLFNYVYDGPR